MQKFYFSPKIFSSFQRLEEINYILSIYAYTYYLCIKINDNSLQIDFSPVVVSHPRGKNVALNKAKEVSYEKRKRNLSW